ncbi:phage major capsid protein [Sphingomonas aerophila]|uniref:HK97 family phage major capsid protein/HK97 family phage prohead protease n=1 Tax=Sphingomonas aerophila TaxID=1344948 RepID=A0A7W9BCT5_9SPHN|nr:phage major capsid protein [Sphingomonas aerophila]MBB5714766.1 HK97 family phage major capsid protein/HK97 family phage prohead protease [Sphingomonas aerophila]
MDVLHKALASPADNDPYEFVLSDETVDRMGDVIDQAGWKLATFLSNPIALFNHDSDFPIGNWENVRVEAGKLRGRLNLLARGLSQRIDELRALVEARMLRATSVGFKPFTAEALSGSKVGGLRYKSQELLECSLVSVPANPNALALAKSLNLSDDMKRLVFGENAERVSTVLRRGCPGETAALNSPHRKASNVATLSERIVTAQNELTRLKDALTDHVKADDADTIVTEELAGQIETQEAALAGLQRAEKALAMKTARPADTAAEPRRPFAAPAKKSQPGDLIIRSAVVQVLAKIEGRSAIDVLTSRYGEDDTIKAMLDVTTKAASAPATTTTSGWAAELVQTATLDFIDTLVAKSVYPVLRDLGGKFTFGRNGVVSIPARSATPSIAGSFVGQGAPIPVRQAGFSASTLTPKKMAVITTFTREIAEKPTPDIEQVLRTAIQEDTGVAIDTVLLDTNAATAIRPAGLRNGVTGVTATTGGGFAALVGDLKALVAALITSSGGNVRQPVWVMNPVQALSISLTQNGAGDFPFAGDLRNGTLLGYPVAQSATVTTGTVALVDAADFFTATGDEPRFEVSDQAVLHMEDSTPQQLSAAGTPNAVAAPIRSMFQTDSLLLNTPAGGLSDCVVRKSV